jgi:cysteine-rich repeat protein
VPREAGSADGALLDADLAIETDHELWAEFGDDDATLRYVARLVAAVNTIWQRDVGVRFRVRFVRVWATPDDPWQASEREAALHELDDYWSNPANGMDAAAGPHAVVHLVSGKSPSQGGIAFLGTACEPTGNFGVSQVHGAFGLLDPAQTWDVDVVAHEIAHAFGSLHSHCYDPPLDHCWNAEPGCWAGPIEAGTGTIMSYCQTLPGGMTNVDLVFGPTVSEVLRTGAVSAGCLERAVEACGDGHVDAGETCDDGNRVDGDCCSAACQSEAEGSACLLPEDGDVCTVGRCDGLGACTAARPSTGTLASTLSAPERAPGCHIPPRLSRLLTRATNLLDAFPPDHPVTAADARHLLHVIRRAKGLVRTVPRACRGAIRSSLRTTRLLTLCTM